jgi:hypothetical protein
MKVVFHEGCLPDFQNFENCFELYWTSSTNVVKHVLLITSYFTTFLGGGIKIKTNSAQFQLKLPTGAELGKNINFVNNAIIRKICASKTELDFPHVI